MPQPFEDILKGSFIKEKGWTRPEGAISAHAEEAQIEEVGTHRPLLRQCRFSSKTSVRLREVAGNAQPVRDSAEASFTAFPSCLFCGAKRRKRVAWMIGRAEALNNPEAARRKALEKLQSLTKLDDPEALVVPILLDALLMVESYRGARHQITFLPELTKSVDDLLRELTIIEKSEAWAAE